MFKLFNAADSNNLREIELLTTERRFTKEAILPAMHRAAIMGNAKIVLCLQRVLLQQIEEDPNYQSAIHPAAVSWAIIFKYSNVASALIHEPGFDPNFQYKDYDVTPLMVAAEEGHADLVRQLLEVGADPTFKDNSGRSALEYAKGREEIVMLLTAETTLQP